MPCARLPHGALEWTAEWSSKGGEMNSTERELLTLMAVYMRILAQQNERLPFDIDRLGRLIDKIDLEDLERSTATAASMQWHEDRKKAK